MPHIFELSREAGRTCKYLPLFQSPRQCWLIQYEHTVLTIFKSVIWLLYRRLRVAYFSVTGRNPLPAAPTIAFDWKSIRGLFTSHTSKPVARERDEAGNTLWDTALGQMWTPPGMTIHFVSMISSEMLSGVYDMRSIEANSVIVDAGANVGFFSRLALSQGAARVIAFEPSPQTAACLRRNLAQWIESGQVIVVEKGLWHESAVLRFARQNAENPGAHHISDTGEIEIVTTTLDSCLAELGVERISYLKMDIEGAEQNALKGASKTLQRDQPVCSIAVEHTDDMIQNAMGVANAMKTIFPGYRYFATECHPYESPSLGTVLCPYALLFTPQPR